MGSQNKYGEIKMNKTDYIGIIQAQIGTMIMTIWGIWSINKYKGIPFLDLSGFITSLGGLV